MTADSTRLERLTTDRDALERAIATAEPNHLAALVREHRAVLKEISALAEPTKGSVRDQLAAKRAARSANAKGAAASEA